MSAPLHGVRHQASSTAKALRKFSGAVGNHGRIGVFVSGLSFTSASAERRAGPYGTELATPAKGALPVA